MSWPSLEQVKAMAPDAASLKVAQELAQSRRWVSLGSNDAACWGECRGSGAEPYKVRLERASYRTACTCPSRKLPCKHALALLLLAANDPQQLPPASPPEWVAEWLQKLAARTTRPTEPKTDPAARQKEAERRAARREQLASEGIASLQTWLADLMRQGLAFAQSAPASFWEEQAKRLVDAQLPGAARQVLEMAEIANSGLHAVERLLLKAARLHLLVRTYSKLDALPEPVRADVRSLLGWTMRQEEVLAAGEGVRDDWLVLARTLEQDQRTDVYTLTHWLWGQNTQRPAQIIQHAYRNPVFDTNLLPGQAVRGELAFYPGAYPLRAAFRSREVLPAAFVPSGWADATVLLEAYAAALGRNPWLEEFPALLEELTPQPIRPGDAAAPPERWLLRDRHGQVLPVQLIFGSSVMWELFALSGGQPLKVFGLWDGWAFWPMAAWEGGRLVKLCKREDEP